MDHRRPHAPALNGLRFVAALMELFGHSMGGFKGLPPNTVYSLINLANAAMSLFFVLSGFVLTYTYEDISRAGWKAVKVFLVSRAARILPLYFLVLFANYFYFGGAPSLKGWITHLTLTQTWLPSPNYPMLFREFPAFDAAWSISAEWFFYLMFGPICWLTWTIRNPLKGAVAVWLCIVGFVAFTIYVWTPPPIFMEWLVYYSPYLRIWEFVIGCMLCRYAIALPPPSLVERKHAILLPILAFVLLVVALETFSARGQTFLGVLKWCGGYTISSAIMVFWAYRYRNAFFSSRLMNAAGEASYSFYLLHVWFSIATATILPNTFATGNEIADFVVNFTISASIGLALSLLTYRFFERPARNAMRLFFLGSKELRGYSSGGAIMNSPLAKNRIPLRSRVSG